MVQTNFRDKTLFNEIEKKKIPSPKLSKILRRQKIHTEPVLSLEEITIPSSNVEKQDLDTEIIINLNISKIFSSYSDLYFQDNRTLNNCLLYLKDFVQSEHNILISNVTYNFNSAFVPFYKSVSNENIPGVILDMPQINLRDYKCDTIDISNNSYLFNEYVPIFSCLNESYHRKSFFDHYSRISLVDVKKRRETNINLDEIMPVIGEITGNIDGSPRLEDRQLMNERNMAINSVFERDILLLDPLLLENVPRQRAKPRLTQSEHKKIATVS